MSTTAHDIPEWKIYDKCHRIRGTRLQCWAIYLLLANIGLAFGASQAEQLLNTPSFSNAITLALIPANLILIVLALRSSIGQHIRDEAIGQLSDPDAITQTMLMQKREAIRWYRFVPWLMAGNALNALYETGQLEIPKLLVTQSQTIPNTPLDTSPGAFTVMIVMLIAAASYCIGPSIRRAAEYELSNPGHISKDRIRANWVWSYVLEIFPYVIAIMIMFLSHELIQAGLRIIVPDHDSIQHTARITSTIIIGVGSAAILGTGLYLSNRPQIRSNVRQSLGLATCTNCIHESTNTNDSACKVCGTQLNTISEDDRYHQPHWMTWHKKRS